MKVHARLVFSKLMEFYAAMTKLNIFSAFVDVIGQRRRIFLLLCSLKVYTVILFL